MDDLTTTVTAYMCMLTLALLAVRLAKIAGSAPLAIILAIIVNMIGCGYGAVLYVKGSYDLTPALWAFPLSILIHICATNKLYKRDMKWPKVGFLAIRPKSSKLNTAIVIGLLILGMAASEFVRGRAEVPPPIKVLSMKIDDAKVGEDVLYTATFVRSRVCHAVINHFITDLSTGVMVHQWAAAGGNTNASKNIQTYKERQPTSHLPAGVYKERQHRTERCPDQPDHSWVVNFEPVFKIVPKDHSGKH